MAKSRETTTSPEEQNDNASQSGVQVRVICEGVLGHKRLKKDDVTDDEEYVALLKTGRGKTLVEKVK